MSNTGATYIKLAIAGILAGFLTSPAIADDYGQASDQQAESSNEQPEAQQADQQKEPVYVWHGNHYAGQDAVPASAPESSYAKAEGGTIVVPTTNNLPKQEESNGIQFITGGIGDEERNALDTVKNQFSLHVVSTNKAGEFDGDTEVTVFSRKGDKIISVTGGPIFYINLPTGSYTVQASSGGRTEKQNISVGSKSPSSAYFRW